MGSKSDSFRTLAAISGVKSAAGGVRSSVLDWRKGWDSNPRYPCRYAGFQDRCLKPLGHPSVSGYPRLSKAGRAAKGATAPATHCRAAFRVRISPRNTPLMISLKAIFPSFVDDPAPFGWNHTLGQ